jgi:pSer/pThr/pTyr-binding forkhead associated (FHA) protein
MANLALMVDGVVVKRFELDKPELTIGRDSNCDIQIDDSAVSSHHAVITTQANRYLPDQVDIVLKDLDSTNGTFVNDIKVTQHQLSNDDDVRVAWNTFKFLDNTRPNFERTAIIIDS